MSSPAISVVVPTLGRIATLARVMDRLDGQSAPARAFELIVAADAASEAGRIDGLLGGRPYRTRRVQATVPGASAARNAGWQAADAPLILFLDDDVLPDAPLVDEHLQWHGRHPEPEVGVLGDVRWSGELRVTPFMRWLEHGIQFNYPSIVGEETVWGNFYTANVSVKRSLVERAGGFDEQRLPYGYEDLDLALRMHRRDGFRLLYNRGAAAQHLHAMDLDFWKGRVERIAASEREFVRKHPDVPAYFHDLFTRAAAAPAVGPAGDRLAWLVPRRIPLVGPFVWARADLFYRQQLAKPFLAAWAAAEERLEPQAPGDPPSLPNSSGSLPGGPK